MPNTLEFEVDFFMRGGDGVANLKPIAHLYKSQVYVLARYLGVSEDFRGEPPSTDTYRLPLTQEKSYFVLSYGEGDLVLYAICNGFESEAIASALSREPGQIEHVVRDFERKRVIATRTLRDSLVLEGVR
jgi:NAD+ synthase